MNKRRGVEKRARQFPTVPEQAGSPQDEPIWPMIPIFRDGRARTAAVKDDMTERHQAVARTLAERARIARETCPYLTAKQAAFHLGIAANTLKRLRHQGRGPLCRLHGGSWRYHIDDLDAWSAARKSGEGA